ncbi:CopG family antitoxin [Deinococcus sp.]|uniref:CopG family antitoxin n=1 Tax=Deinococcus sp. TaxID=47478 RepID=UPI0025ED071F|nr:CopG family antitoxin [Deinococcus sp.]
MTNVEENNLIPVYSRSEIPTDMSEAQEAEFWSTHGFTEELAAENAGDPELAAFAALLPKRPRKSNPVSLRLSVDLERRLRHLAELKGTTYQTLLKEFVLERVYEEEKRLKTI